MSKAFVSKADQSLLQPFSSLLHDIDPVAILATGEVKLGKTASMLATLKSKAYDEGYEEGIHAGHETGRQESIAMMHAECEAYAEQFATELNSMSEIIQQGITQWYRSAEEALAGLAMVIAARVVAQDIQLSPETALSIAKEAVAEVTHAEKAVIRINPFSSELLKENIDAIMAMSPSLKTIQIVDDPTILGGCVIESAGGRIDATIESRVGALLQAAIDHYDSRATPPSEMIA